MVIESDIASGFASHAHYAAAFVITGAMLALGVIVTAVSKWRQRRGRKE